MEKQRFLINKIFFAVLMCIAVVLSAVSGRYISPAFAETDIVTAFECTNVYDDLTGSTLGGSSFDIAEYPHNSVGKPQIISFAEFCYSYYANNQSDYGLYVYVYNPQDKAIDVNGGNKVQFTYGDCKNYAKYSLEFLNYSTQAGYEGRFYKFRVNLSDAERAAILRDVLPDKRVYSVSGIELSYNNVVSEYGCAQTYTYSGFAKGYGSELAESDTLSCTVDGFDRYITLDVKSTEWRSASSAKGKNYQNQLNSVYFSVPNKFFESYGMLQEITAEWYEYKTDWITVTSDATLYSYMKKNMGRKYFSYDESGNISRIADSDAPYGLFGWDCITPSGSSSAYLGRFTYGFMLDNMTHNTSYVSNPSQSFHYAFYSDKPITETFLDSDVLSDWIYSYKDKYNVSRYLDCKGGQAIPADLFVDVVDEGRTRGYNRVAISSNDSYDLLNYADNHSTWDKINDFGFWNTLLGNVPTDGTILVDEPIKPLKKSDYENTDKSTYSESLYIAGSDVDEFDTYIHNAWDNNETPVLFRFAVTDYYAAYGTALDRSGGSYESRQQTLVGSQETVFFDFDIIQLAFRKDNVTTVIPVVSSPVDIIGNITPPPYDPNGDGIPLWFKLVLAAIIFLLIVILLWQTGLLPFATKAVVWVVAAPFKGVAWLVTQCKQAIKNRKERKAQKQAQRRQRQRQNKHRRGKNGKR